MNNSEILRLLANPDLINAELARRSFHEFRLFVRPSLIDGWFLQDLSKQMQEFYEDFCAGKKPTLIIEAPPQHGKSIAVIDFIAWITGHKPELRTIFASFSDDLGKRANRQLQRIFNSDEFALVFPKSAPLVMPHGGERTQNHIKYDNNDGEFRNTTIEGQITGKSIDLGVIDDPIKGRKAANSPAIRNNTWDWFNDDFMTRYSENAATLMVMTRWHIDDPAGRLIESDTEKRVRVVKYKAIATEAEDYRDPGEPLHPELKSLEFLLMRKARMAPSSWESLYQASPYLSDGGIFSESWWQYYTVAPTFRRRIIYMDTAQKDKEQNDFNVFQVWGQTHDNKIYLLDQLRGRWQVPDMEVRAEQFYNKHKIQKNGNLVAVKVEDKVSGTGLIQKLMRKGVPVVPIQRDKDKVMRANDAAPYVMARHVYLPEEAEWLSDYITELSAFPGAAHDDQVDPTVDAINDMLGQLSDYDYGKMLHG